MIMGLKENIKVKLGSEKDCIQSVSVEYSNAKVKEKIEQAFKNVQQKAKMPGFRPGKTPIEIVKQNFKDTAYAQAQDNLLREGVAEAIQSKNIQAVQTPMISSVKFDPDKAFQFEFQVEIAPTFKLSSHKGIKVTQKSSKITDKDVSKRLDEIADGNAKLNESKAEKLTKKHFANINYEGFLDDKPIAGTKTDNFLMDLSAQQAISGLSDGLIGMKAGEKKDIPVEFPKDSPVKELAGKKAIFKVEVLAIKEKQVPKLDDEFAKDLGMKSFDELKNRVKENMEKEKEQEARKDTEKQIIDKLLEANKFSVPKSLIDRQAENLVSRQKYRMAQQGYKEAEQAKIIESLKPQIQPQAEREVRLAYVLNQVAEIEKISVTDDDVKAKIEGILAQSKPEERAGMENLLNGTYKDQLRSELKDTKIFDWLIANAKIKK